MVVIVIVRKKWKEDELKEEKSTGLSFFTVGHKAGSQVIMDERKTL